MAAISILSRWDVTLPGETTHAYLCLTPQGGMVLRAEMLLVISHQILNYEVARMDFDRRLFNGRYIGPEIFIVAGCTVYTPYVFLMS